MTTPSPNPEFPVDGDQQTYVGHIPHPDSNLIDSKHYTGSHKIKIYSPIIKYIRHESNHRRLGLMYACKYVHRDKGYMGIGYSAMHYLDIMNGTKYDHEYALNLAVNRAIKFNEKETFNFKRVPELVLPEIAEFAERCEKYYKEVELPEWVKNILLPGVIEQLSLEYGERTYQDSLGQELINRAFARAYQPV